MQLIKLSLFTFILSLSGYSYFFIHQESQSLATLIASEQQPKEKKVLIHNPKNNTTKLIIIAPPSPSTVKAHQEDDTLKAKDKEVPARQDNILPDVEFLKFVIQKSKEGIPVLHFRDFLQF